MTRPISWWQKLQPRRVFTAALVAGMVLVGTVTWLGGALPAQAALTPDTKSYAVNHSPTQTPLGVEHSKADQAGSGLVESLKDTAETVREKLNLDEPLPQGTKLFIKQLQGEDVQVNEPKPGGKGEEPLNE
jgi:hypothetical protein